MATRWAICGAGNISSDFCVAVSLLPKSENEIVAVAASNKERAAKFAEKFGIPNSFGSYEDLSKQDNIDVIYIGLRHAAHVETTLLFVNAGKNVLCEKPMAGTVEGVQRVTRAAKDNGVFVAEGFWTRYFPVYRMLREQLDNGAIGDVRMLQVTFCASVPLSAMMSIGVYCLGAAQFVFREKPVEIVARGKIHPTVGADVTGVLTLRYTDDRFASLTYITDSASGKSSMVVRGSKGNIVIPDFMWCPTEIILPDGQRKEFPLQNIDESKLNYPRSHGFVYQIQGVRDALKKGLKESPVISLSDSEEITREAVECLAQMGLENDFP